MTPKSGDFHEKLTFLEHAQEALMQLVGCVAIPGSVPQCAGSNFRLPKVEQKIPMFSTCFMLNDVFRLFSCSVVVVQESVLKCNTRVIEQDTWSEKEKALRVPRAVNIG